MEQQELQQVVKLTDSLDLEDIKDIGTTTAKKLRDAGYLTVMDLATAMADELVKDIGGSRETAESHINNALTLINENKAKGEFITGTEALKMELQKERIPTGSVLLDQELQGGIETGSVYEFFGEFGSSKTQICYTLAAIAPQPIEKGGLGCGVIFLDTETTFRASRIQEIAKSRELDDPLDKVIWGDMANAAHLELTIKRLGKLIDEYKAKLVIIDSVIALHRAEFTGRGTLAERQQRLSVILEMLKRRAKVYNIAVVFTNQVVSSPDTFFGDPTKPTGGNIVGHSATHRIYLKKSGANRIARVIDSPVLPYNDAGVKYTVNNKGIDDIADEIKKFKK